MGWDFGIIKSIDKIPIRVIIWVIASAAILLLLPLLPINYPNELSHILNKVKGYCWVAIITLIMWLIVHKVFLICQKRTNKIPIRELKKNIINSIKTLDNKEKAFLREYFIRKQNTIDFPINNPVIAGLISKKILILVGNVSTEHLCFPIAMQLIAYSYISQDRTIIGYPKNDPTEEELEKMKKERPDLSHPMQKCL